MSSSTELWESPALDSSMATNQLGTDTHGANWHLPHHIEEEAHENIWGTAD